VTVKIRIKYSGFTNALLPETVFPEEGFILNA